MTDKTFFRSIDEWKSALMTLPDGNFFELLRSVLGNIKTPFSKQRLLEDLFNLLSRDEIRGTISAYINEPDHKVIAAVALLNEPAPGELENFFAGEFTPAELHALVINLEERLILYRFTDGGVRRLALNPVLQELLLPFIADTGPLFVSRVDDSEAGADAAGDSLPEGRIMAALFAFIMSEDDLFKAEGGLRKKTLDDGKKIFGRLDLELAIQILLLLGLFRQEGRGLVLCKEWVASYRDLGDVERREYWAAALYLCLREPDPAAHNNGFPEAVYEPRFSRSRLHGAASFIHRFRGLMENGRKYPEVTLRRLWDLLEKGSGKNAWGYVLFDSRPQFPFEPLLEAVEKTGLLEKTGVYWRAPSFPEDFPPAAGDAPEGSSGGTQPPRRGTPEKPVIVMDAAFSFVLYPEVSFADAVALGEFCSVKENASTAVRFELTRQSVVRGFDQGIGADQMLALLDRLSLNRLEPNLGWTLKDWESRYTGVSLHQGIVLTLAEDRRYLAEVGAVSSLIQKTLAPGVYLLSPGEKSEAVKALLKAGVDIVAQPPSAAEPGSGRYGYGKNAFTRLASPGSAEFQHEVSFPALDKPAARQVSGGGKKSPESVSDSSDSSDSIKQNFREALEKMKLTRQEQEELLARIERRLILSEAQLEATSLRYEKLEARGLDYAGKSAIAKQAIESGSLLEVSWPGQGGELNRAAGIPQALEKKEGETVLVLRTGGNSDNADRVLRIPLGKISLLRRIKQSIFGE